MAHAPSTPPPFLPPLFTSPLQSCAPPFHLAHLARPWKPHVTSTPPVSNRIPPRHRSPPILHPTHSPHPVATPPALPPFTSHPTSHLLTTSLPSLLQLVVRYFKDPPPDFPLPCQRINHQTASEAGEQLNLRAEVEPHAKKEVTPPHCSPPSPQATCVRCCREAERPPPRPIPSRPIPSYPVLPRPVPSISPQTPTPASSRLPPHPDHDERVLHTIDDGKRGQPRGHIQQHHEP